MWLSLKQCFLYWVVLYICLQMFPEVFIHFLSDEQSFPSDISRRQTNELETKGITKAIFKRGTSATWCFLEWKVFKLLRGRNAAAMPALGYAILCVHQELFRHIIVYWNVLNVYDTDMIVLCISKCKLMVWFCTKIKFTLFEKNKMAYPFCRPYCYVTGTLITFALNNNEPNVDVYKVFTMLCKWETLKQPVNKRWESLGVLRIQK